MLWLVQQVLLVIGDIYNDTEDVDEEDEHEPLGSHSVYYWVRKRLVVCTLYYLTRGVFADYHGRLSLC